MILVNEKVINGIKYNANLTFPNECCGFLSGKRRKQLLNIDKYHPCENISNLPKQEFKINPVCHIKLQKKLRSLDREVIGVYHSHPNGALELSKKDIYYFGDNNLLWFIIALLDANKSNVIAYMKKNDIKEKFMTCEYNIKYE
ncbi:MAG: hypothetical protein CMM18_03530 [Rhodospirillaceae bacterium]|nr:hypothetical protein [Rhodospirillaceae bacterium]|tara:strand:- start:498 stop:926 length:429 start_codon:yes stop_codon:yes gene_type:complete